MRNWLFRETRNFAKRPVCFAKQRNSFRIDFRETKSETSFAGNPKSSLYERLMCAVEFFRQQPNFLVDLAENIFHELTTLAFPIVSLE
jgi:hypothetical protein